jgi:hypothetical protein
MDVRGGVRARWCSNAVLQREILGSAEQKPAQPERPQDDRVGDQSLHPAEADAVHVLPGEQHQCGERDDPEPHRVVREGDAFVRKGGDRGQTPEEERDERAAEVAPSGRLGEYPHADRPCARKDDEKRWHGAKRPVPMSAPQTIAAPKTMTEALKRRAVRPTPRSLMALFAML